MKTGRLRAGRVKADIEPASWWCGELAVQGAGRVAAGQVGLLPREAAGLGADAACRSA